MTLNDHQRAESLIARLHFEGGVSLRERQWLGAHLAGCAACSGRRDTAARVVRLVEARTPPPSAELLRQTRLRVQVRAAELRERQMRERMLWLSAAISVLSMIVTAPSFWLACEWLGGRLAMPPGVWQTVFVMGWFLPATVAAAVIGWRRNRRPLAVPVESEARA